MIRFLVDENLSNAIIRALLRQAPDIDIVRVQDVGLSGADDPAILQWAAVENRVLLTHDVSTMTEHAYNRVRDGLPMPGVFEVPRSLGVGKAVEDIQLIARLSNDGEWEGQVRYLPLQ